MLVDALELLDQQVAFLTSREDLDFVWSLRPFVESLQKDPRIERVFSELVHGSGEELDGIDRARMSMRDALVKLRRAIAQAFPELDDGDVAFALMGDPGWSEYRCSLAYFDKMASASVAEKWPETRASHQKNDILVHMVRVLREKWNGPKKVDGVFV